ATPPPVPPSTPPPAPAPAAPPPLPRSGPSSRPLLPRPTARVVAFAALGLWAAIRWSTLVEPMAWPRTLMLLILALIAGLTVGQLSRLPPFAQAPGAFAVVVAWAAASALAAGVPAAFIFEPTHWDDLALGLQQGIEALPQLLVPYSQPDDWPRIAILLGGGLLLVLGCVLGLTPGRHGTPLRDGAPFGGGVGLRLVAAIPLVVAALVPPAIMKPDAPALEGLVLLVLLSAVLWLEELPRARARAAMVLVVLTAVTGAVATPLLDRDKPLFDLQALVEGLQRTDPAQFDWSQSYGPLDWPRTGREVLRVKSPVSTYWKTQNLDGFDGIRWMRQAPPEQLQANAEVPPRALANADWHVNVQVTIGELSTFDVIGAGTTLGFRRAPASFAPGASPGTWVSDEALRQGDGYVAETFVPRPSQAQRANAGTDYPAELQRYTIVSLPQQDGPRRWQPGPGSVPVPLYGSVGDGAPTAIAAEQAFAASPYAREYALASQLVGASSTPYEYVQEVLAYLRNGFTYSETPPRRQLPLDAFLFRDRIGYCQQFAGAAALLLRLGGVPTRVATGFTRGKPDGAEGEYVVRDYDAHAWIEVWFPGIGWVQADPTPTTAPAISGRAPPPTRLPAAATAPAARARMPTPPAATTPRTTPAAQPAGGASGGDGDGGGGLPLGALVAGLLALVAGAGWLRWWTRPRQDGDALLGELRRALRRTGRPPEARTTLLELERRLHDAPDAAAYVRAIRLARYAGEPPHVTGGQRRALRAELARNLGLGGRLRALHALPPRRVR
ncbi:transglutaminase-like domain-containing protein, partial [Conexibacter sp. CPCC 205706]